MTPVTSVNPVNSATAAGGPLLTVDDLHTYLATGQGVVRAVDGVSFSVGEAEVLGIVGESGCGKTVTCRTIMGLMPRRTAFSSGKVIYHPRGSGSLLDNTTIVWTNELGKGNSHTLDNIPFLLVGGGFGFQMGRSLKFEKVPHNRLHLALAHAVGHRLETFGKAALCEGGPLKLA